MRPKPTLVLLALTFFVSLALGTFGFREVAPETGWLSSVYLAIQLFTMGSGGVEGEIPWSLELARWLAPVGTLGGLLAAASVVFDEFRRRIGLGLVRSHVVICGAGEKGRFIAEDLLRDPQVSARIVVIEQNPSPGSVTELERLGAIVMTGDAQDASTLRRARVATASRVVCLAGDDRTNLAIAMVVAGQVPAERNRDPLWIHVHLSDIARRDILERNRALDPASRTQFRIVGFNHFRNLSRCIMDAFPLECDRNGKVAGQVHLILPGLGRAKGGESESTGGFGSGDVRPGGLGRALSRR